MKRLAALLAVATALVAGCTSSGPGPAQTETQTIIHTVPPPQSSTSQAPPPVQSTGPTTVTEAASCPLMDEQSAADKTGMRLDRITVLKSAGKVSGCRFYGLQHPNSSCPQSCLSAEKLPPGNQPAIEITSMRYADAGAAHDASVTLAGKSPNTQPATIAAGTHGLCFQTRFYSKDNGKDWACTFTVGATLVLVKTVGPSFNAIEIAKAVAPAF